MYAFIYLPVRILIADGNCRKLQAVFKFHTDVDVLGMREQVSHLWCDQVSEDGAWRHYDQQPQNSDVTHRTNRLYTAPPPQSAPIVESTDEILSAEKNWDIRMQLAFPIVLCGWHTYDRLRHRLRTSNRVGTEQNALYSYSYNLNNISHFYV